MRETRHVCLHSNLGMSCIIRCKDCASCVYKCNRCGTTDLEILASMDFE
jgi:hypothetical protein